MLGSRNYAQRVVCLLAVHRKQLLNKISKFCSTYSYGRRNRFSRLKMHRAFETMSFNALRA